MSNSIAFNNRNKSDFLNKKIREMLRESPQYDVDLLAANGKIVPAHRFVLSMYSKYLQKVLAHSTPDAKLIVVLKRFTNFTLEKVVELFYVGEIRLTPVQKNHVMKALDFLQVSSLALPEPRPIIPRIYPSVFPNQPEHLVQKINSAAKRPQNPNTAESKPLLTNSNGLPSSNSACAKDQTPTEEATISSKNAQVKSHSTTAIEISANRQKQQQPQQSQSQLVNEASSNVPGQSGMIAKQSSIDEKSNKGEGIGVNLLYDDISDDVNGLRESVKDLMEDTIIGFEDVLSTKVENLSPK